MMASSLVEAPLAASDTSPGTEFTCQIAATRRSRLASFRLVYQKYLQAELIQPNEFGLRVTPYHLHPTTNIFTASENGRVVCTVTLIGDGRLGLPMESIYADEVNERRRQKLYVGEVSCLAFDPMPLNRFLMVFMQLTRLMAQHARRYGMDQFLIAVHPQHARFYQRFMGFEQIGPLKTYPSVRDAPAVACCLDFAAIDRDHPKCYGAYFGTRLPEHELISHPMSEDERLALQPIAELGGMPQPQCAFG